MSLHLPRKYMCKTCDNIKVKTDAADTDGEKRVLVAELELHRRKSVLVAEFELHHRKSVLVAELELHHRKKCLGG